MGVEDPSARPKRLGGVRLLPWLILSVLLTTAGFLRLALERPMTLSRVDWSVVVIGCLQAGVVAAAAYAWLRRKQPTSLADLFLLGVGLRLAWAVTLFAWSMSVGWGGRIAGDDRQFFEIGSLMADAVRAGQMPPVPTFGGYYLYNMVVNVLSGRSAFAPIALNSVIGALSVVHIYRIAFALFDPFVARGAAVLAIVTPELCFWSATNLKDTHVIFATVAVTDWLVSFERDRSTSPSWLVYVGLLMMYLVLTRPVIALAFFGLVAIRLSSAYLHHLTLRKAVGGLAAFVLLVGVLFNSGYYPGGEAWENLSKYDSSREGIASSYEPGSLSAIANPVAIRERPYLAGVAYAYTLITPFPFFALHVLGDTTAEFAAMFAGVLFWYAAMPPAIVGLCLALSRRPVGTLPVTWWVFFIWTSMALETGGATFRYRASMAPFLMILAAVGLRHARGWMWLAAPYTTALIGLCVLYLSIR